MFLGVGNAVAFVPVELQFHPYCTVRTCGLPLIASSWSVPFALPASAPLFLLLAVEVPWPVLFASALFNPLFDYLLELPCQHICSSL